MCRFWRDKDQVNSQTEWYHGGPPGRNTTPVIILCLIVFLVCNSCATHWTDDVAVHDVRRCTLDILWRSEGCHGHACARSTTIRRQLHSIHFYRNPVSLRRQHSTWGSLSCRCGLPVANLLLRGVPLQGYVRQAWASLGESGRVWACQLHGALGPFCCCKQSTASYC